jgi:DNA-binding MarR family transcriptional regulator
MSDDQRDLEAIEAGLLALHKTNFQHRAWDDIQARAGISMDRASALLLKVVAQCDKTPCRMQDIAKLLGIEAPSVTRTVQELEHAGLVMRQTDPDDKRASRISLTKAGQQQLAKLQKARRERLTEALQGWTKTERQQMGALLQRLAQDIAKTY